MRKLIIQISYMVSFLLLTSCNLPDANQMRDKAIQAKAESEKAESQNTENSLFDNHKQEPVELLLQAFKRNRILLLGLSGHETSQHLYYLSKLLEKVGTDPKLKYIIL